MSLTFGLDELATEGEHAARIVAVKELGVVKGQFRSEEKVRIMFEMLDQPDANGEYARVVMTYAAKVTKGSHLGRLLDDMGWSRNGRDFNIHWVVGETMHVDILHNKDGRFANITHVIKDPAVIREYRRPCPWTGCTEFVNPHDDAEVKSGRCYLHCYLKSKPPEQPFQSNRAQPSKVEPEYIRCAGKDSDGDRCCNDATIASGGNGEFCGACRGEL